MRALVAAALLIATAASAQPASPDRKISYQHDAMGTSVNLTIWTDRQADAAETAKAVFAEMDRLDREMTTWHRDGEPDGDVIKINNAAGKSPVKVSDETLAVIQRALDVSRKTGGLFDITVGGFHGLWKFDEDMDGSLPAPAEVKKRLALINYKDVIVDAHRHTVFLRKKGELITLGGIAKGYSVDKCVELLHERGFVDFIMQAGGDMYVAGKKGADPWVVGIRDPRGPASSSFVVAPIEDHSFSTSGDYERGFVKDGVRYHHILDPRSGMPAHASRSVTVRATDAFTADAWSKVMFILGPADSMALLAKLKLPDFEVVWVDANNQVVTTPGIAPALHKLKDPTPGP
jgi:thiamine biosynthesis lipoprotein